MSPDQVKELLQSKLPECEFQVLGDGSHFEVTAIGAVFESLNAVKKQQLIYGVLNEEIKSGAIHALIIKTYSPQEWAAR